MFRGATSLWSLELNSSTNVNRAFVMRTLILISVLISLLTLSQAFPNPQEGPGYGKQPEGFFQYVNVPAHKQYEFGWNRGNPHHYISRFEQAKDHKFRTRVRWGDKHDGYGESYWEYNHGPKHDDYKHDDYKEAEYKESKPSYTPPKYPA